MNKLVFIILSSLAVLVVSSCDSSSTTNGTANRGEGITQGPEADQQRGGHSGDWGREGSGRPGSAPTPKANQKYYRSDR